MSSTTGIAPPNFSLNRLYGFIESILGPDSGTYYLAMLYGVGISLLSLATPVSVQLLINNVANTSLTTPLFVLTGALLVLLLLSGLLNALRIHLMDIFQRRFYSRMVAETALHSLYAANPFFEDNQQGPLFNRYFDIVIIQKNLPNLVVSGFTILLQTVVGFVLVSLYHPLFLVFNVIVATLIWVIWAIWSRRAIESAVQASHQKHETAAWLQSLGHSNGFYKSREKIEHALKQTDEVTARYIDKHIKHFRHHFAQTVSFLILYAVSSSALLGLGGWLVINGELTLGQLVAAELVLSAAFYGVSYLGIYLAYFYDLCAAVDELSLFFGIVQEDSRGNIDVLTGDARLTFVECRGSRHGMTNKIDFEAPSGARIMAVAETASMQREFCNLLKRHMQPLGGYVAVGGTDMRTLSAQALGQQVMVLDRPSTVEMTIREYLRLNSAMPGSEDELNALRLVGLESAVMMLDDGLDTRLASTGWPLTTTETIQLKLASAVIAKPRVLVLSQLLDVMRDKHLRRSLDVLQAEADCTVVFFTGRQRSMNFDSYLYLGTNQQELFTSLDELKVAAGNDIGNTSSDLNAPDDGEISPA